MKEDETKLKTPFFLNKIRQVPKSFALAHVNPRTQIKTNYLKLPTRLLVTLYLIFLEKLKIVTVYELL